MNKDHLLEAQRHQPFTPFLVKLSDGTSYTIHHPELIWITDDLVGITKVIEEPTGSRTLKPVLCDLDHVVALEWLSRNESGRK